jgi:hypothetical protein
VLNAVCIEFAFIFGFSTGLSSFKQELVINKILHNKTRNASFLFSNIEQ